MLNWIIEHRWKIAIAALVVAIVLAAVFLLFPALWPSAFLFHYVVMDLYQNMWSNIFAPSAITLAAVAFSFLRSKIHRQKLHDEKIAQAERHQEELKKHITNAVGGISSE